MQTRHVTFSILVLLVLSGAVFAQGEAEARRTQAEIRINLPADSDSRVSVSPEGGRIVVELPGGSVFPMDFSDASGGLLRGGKVIRLDDGRERLELTLAMGLLERVDFEPDALVLRLGSRFGIGRKQEGVVDGYVLGPEDKLEIFVHNQPDLSSRVTVPREGVITFPLVGDVRAAGLTSRELAGKLTERLGRSFLVDPQVEVSISEYRSQWVMLAGEVRIPGRVTLRGGTRLKQVLSESGGFNDSSGEQITISRRVGNDDDFMLMEIDRADFENGISNPVLTNGDLITVNRAAYCYLQGEVRAPNRIRVERGMTLLKAISLAGGLTDWADQKDVKILDGDGGKPRDFNLRQIRKGKVQDPVLRGGEIIVVERRFL